MTGGRNTGEIQRALVIGSTVRELELRPTSGNATVTLVPFERPANAKPVFVNPALVAYVYEAEKGCIIKFSGVGGDSVLVAGTVDTVVAKLQDRV